MLEGIDASGTSTQIARVRAALEARGHRVVCSHEPTDRAIGRQIRSWLAADVEAPPPDAIALLFAADRLDHVRNLIEPTLASGAHLLCDRYVMSSWAYQSLDCPEDWVRAINRRAPWPDHTFWFDVPVDIALARAAARIAAQDAPRERFDEGALQRRLDARYREFAADPELAIEVVDASASIEAVTESIVGRLVELGL